MKRCRKLQVCESGLIICKAFPFIGCSPDGIVSCACHQKRLLEIKCPYSMRNAHPKDAAMAHGCCLNNGRWSLHSYSEYYYQIQAQMGIADIDQCDLVVYTVKGIHPVTVRFDAEFYNLMLSKVIIFFQNHVFPSLLRQYEACGAEL